MADPSTNINQNTNLVQQPQQSSNSKELNLLLDKNTNKSKFAYPIFKNLSNDLSSLQGKNIQYFFQGFDGATLTLGELFKDVNGKNLNSGFLGTSPGYVIEQGIYKFLQSKRYQINHAEQGSTWDYIITIGDPQNNGNFSQILLDSKSAIKEGNAKVSDNQYFYVDEFGNLVQKEEVMNKNKDIATNDPKFIIYTIYTPSINNDIVVLTINSCTLIPIFLMTQGQRVSLSGYNKLTQEYRNMKSEVQSIYENLIFSHTGKQEPRSLSETINYLDYNINESKKRIQLKKFIEENFNKKGEHITPKDGNSKCTLHPEYDKNLLRFFAEHGISKIMSAYGKNVPSLGYSASEEKWYGWSHRAIYGFGVGDKIDKATCGYKKMKEKGLIPIKTLDQAKEVAKIFAKDVA